MGKGVLFWGAVTQTAESLERGKPIGTPVPLGPL